MVCKKCGCDALITEDDWLICPKCGAKYFNTEINTAPTATEKIDLIESAGKENQSPEKQDSFSQESEIEDNNSDGKKEKSKLRETVEFLIPIVIAVIIAILLKTFVFANAVVPTGSMIGTININDRIIASRVAYNSSDPERYDIIMLYYPDDDQTPFVKRIIGLPGETLEVINGVAYITDSEGNLYQTDQSFVNPEEIPAGNAGPFYIPAKGEVITVIDDYSYAENGMIVGTYRFVDKYCKKNGNGDYVIAENLYFTMGDNRNHSEDSRYWDNKYVAESKIMGKVMFKYYPHFEKLNNK